MKRLFSNFKKRNIGLFFPIVTGVLLLCGCTQSFVMDDGKKTDSPQGATIDSEIVITMKESSLRTLQLYFSTTKIYPCCNYPIDLSWKRSSNIIDISFKGIIKTELCLTALGPATATIDLSALSNGTYRLNFQDGNLKRSGELIVSSNSYKIVTT